MYYKQNALVTWNTTRQLSSRAYRITERETGSEMIVKVAVQVTYILDSTFTYILA